jgi:hypothetical protein
MDFNNFSLGVFGKVAFSHFFAPLWFGDFCSKKVPQIT